MTELDEKILALKRGGVSLRRIGTALGISHIAVLKRLKGLEASGKVLTEKRVGVSPEQTEGKENMSPGSKPHRSRHSEGPQGSGNQVVTPKAPSPISDKGVTARRKPSRDTHRAEKEVSQDVCLGVDDLVGAIKGFLEANGIRVYPLRLGCEAYQASHKDQVLRIYVTRRSDPYEEAAGEEDPSRP